MDFPTKSGVLGLLCCARGAGGDEKEWLEAWADMDMQVIAYGLTDTRGNLLPRQPLMRDFQMVGSGFDDRDPWATLMVPKTSEGKKAVGGGTKLTYRYYLQDMAFAVAIQGPDALLNEAAEALARPVWDLYLGRKNCVPVEFISQGVFDTAALAFQFSEKLASDKGRSTAFHVKQGEHEGEVLTLNDVPLQFGEYKKYRDRRVTILSAE